jgi:hypothetical protein
MTVAAVATVAPSALNGGFLRVSANCRDSRATVAATLLEVVENSCNRALLASFGSTTLEWRISAGFEANFDHLSTARLSPEIGVPGGRGFPPFRGNPLTRLNRLGGAA